MFRRIFSAGWGQLVAGLLSFLSLRLFSALLGPDEFGTAMLAMGAISLLDGVASLAFSQVLVLLLKDYADRPERLGLALGLSRYFLIWMVPLCCIGILTGWWWFGGKEAIWLTAALALFVTTEGLRVTGQTIAMLERRYQVLSSWTAIDGLASLTASVGMIQLTGANPVAVPIGLMLGRSLSTGLMVTIAIGRPRGWTADRIAAATELPRAVRFGWSIAAMAPLGWIAVFADRYIINATTGIVAAGVLAALASAVTRPYAITSAALTNVFRPELVDAIANRKGRMSHPLRNWVITGALIGLAGTAAFALVGGLFAEFLIKFPTPGIDRGLIMVFLAVSQGFVLMTHAVDNQLLAKGWGKSLLASHVGMTVVGLPIIVIGTKIAGAEGAAVGRVVNEALKLLTVATILTLRQKNLNANKPRQAA